MSERAKYAWEWVLFLLFWSAACALLLLGPSWGQGAQVTVIWDRSRSTNVAGYRVYWGSASRKYTESLDIGRGTVATITNLQATGETFFAATSYLSNGLESVFSSEARVKWPVTRTIWLQTACAPGGPWTDRTNVMLLADTGNPCFYRLRIEQPIVSSGEQPAKPRTASKPAGYRPVALPPLPSL